jgi:hypothetical protein
VAHVAPQRLDRHVPKKPHRSAHTSRQGRCLRTFAEDPGLTRELRDGLDVTVALRPRPQAERDRALRNHVETIHFLDEETGELYQPAEPPSVNDPDGDEDSEVGT